MMCGEQFAEFAKVALEAARCDDFDDPPGTGSRVPHGVGLSARLGHVAARSQDHFVGVGAEADLAFEHDRMLVLASVLLRRGDRAHREGMLDDRDFAAVIAAVEFVDGAESWHTDAFPVARMDHREFRRAGDGRSVFVSSRVRSGFAMPSAHGG
jgi:hypothetical protein